MNARITLALIAFLVGACASGGGPVVDFYSADSETLGRFRAMQVVADAGALTAFRRVGEVQGYFCQKGLRGSRSVYSDIAKLEAIDQVKLKAAQQGATHIGTPSCVATDKNDFSRNCTGTVICTAAVLKPVD